MDVVVEVGGWEHECCGPAIERNEVIELHCIRWTGPDGRVRLVESHHHIDPEERVHGWVTDIQVVQDGEAPQPILRVPSGQTLRGFDDDNDGHLEEPWTGAVIERGSGDFLVTVRKSDQSGRYD